MLIKICFRLIGLLFILFSLTYIPPILLSFFMNDGALIPFIYSSLITFFLGLILWYPFRKNTTPLKIRDGFLVVSLIWTGLCLISSLPFIFTTSPLTLTDALFESMSGITTTGSTIIKNLATLPSSLLFYRQQLQFLGGMGIVILATAILPKLGIGGLQLFNAENSNFTSHDRLTPHIAQTAKILWLTYTLLTLGCFLLYYCLGMTGFDAICYAFSTVSTGGFAPYNENFGHFVNHRNNVSLQICALFFMLLSSISFSLHFIALKKKQINHYLKNSEFKFFSLSLLIFSGLTLYTLSLTIHPFSKRVILAGLFHVISLSTSTGFTTYDFSAWPNLIPHLLIIIGLIGGCTGSTSGGLKNLRLLVALKGGARELKQLIHPQGVFFIKINGHAIKHRIIISIWGFLSIYACLFFFFILALLATGLDFNTAFSATIASLANLGPALGKASYTFASLPNHAKNILTLAMLIGRLEIFTIIILIFPSFWRH